MEGLADGEPGATPLIAGPGSQPSYDSLAEGLAEIVIGFIAEGSVVSLQQRHMNKTLLSGKIDTVPVRGRRPRLPGLPRHTAHDS